MFKHRPREIWVWIGDCWTTGQCDKMEDTKKYYPPTHKSGIALRRSEADCVFVYSTVELNISEY